MNKAEITIKDLDEIRSKIIIQIDTLTLEDDALRNHRDEARDPYDRNQTEHVIHNLNEAMDALDEAIEQIKMAQNAVRCAGKHGWT